MRPVIVCLIVLSLFPITGHSTRAKTGVVGSSERLDLQDSDDAKIVKILTNPVLWNTDFPSLLRTLKSWNNSGELRVAVLSNEAFGERRFNELSSELLNNTREFHSALGKMPSLKPDVEAALNDTWSQTANTVTVVSQPSRDDGSLRVSLTSKAIVPPAFLAPELTLEIVRQQTGDPEKVTSEVIGKGEGERRPEILTLHQYAGGAIVFAVSDMSPIPDKIDRVILDTGKISKAIFVNSQQ